ncbi:hypothetical protein BT63DRAFT_442909 [Microthyrium microscopicum]|uniref:Uncharacterized protein n=1 Tax=Microthyrium microscopicum TaxID=703497 RepID=A0A6A6U3L1_9PEZI|nr:hypothetical protein BT63DRAFT_442909 [Microthyrium microscopicum]
MSASTIASISRLTENSPTAHLLRSSRLFSIPAPLPRPNLHSLRSGKTHISDTATSPYPTHQVITTTDSSRHRGDWGLKRSLPLKTTSTARALRVTALDTFDEVTEYQHAHDHAKTLAKLQELNLDFVRPPQGTQNLRGRPRQPSAFEPRYDQTAPKPMSLAENITDRALGSGAKATLPSRWKRRGPELRDMPEGQFTQYLDGVSSQSKDFVRFLKAHYITEMAPKWARRRRPRGMLLKKDFFRAVAAMTHAEAEAYLLGSFPDFVGPVDKASTSRPWLESKPVEFSMAARIARDKLAYERLKAAEREAERLANEQVATDRLVAMQVEEDSLAKESNEYLDSQPEAGESQEWAGSTPETRRRILEMEESHTSLQNAGTESAEILSNAQEESMLRERMSKLQEHVEVVERQFGLYISADWEPYLIRFRNSSADPRYSALIEYFFDLPETQTGFAERKAELTTHPSAGVSYRRAPTAVVNHPEFGPMADPLPHMARQVVGRTFALAGTREPRFSGQPTAGDSDKPGLAGLVVTPAYSQYPIPFSTDRNTNNIVSSKYKSYDAQTGEATVMQRGTAKGWVVVNQARVAASGRLEVQVSQPMTGTTRVAEGALYDLIAKQKAPLGNPLDEEPKFRVQKAKGFEDKEISDGKPMMDLMQDFIKKGEEKGY